TFESNSLKPLYVVDFGENKIPLKLAKSEAKEIDEAFFNSGQNYIGRLNDISENDDYITCSYTSFSITCEKNFIFHSKEGNELYSISRIYYYKESCKIYPQLSVYNNTLLSIVARDFEDKSSSDLLPSGLDYSAIALYSIKRGL